MKSSRGEIKICDILDAAGLNYIEEYSFPDLVSSSGRPLRFDFAVFADDGDLDFQVAAQTPQHYEAKSKYGGAKGLYRQKYNDEQKRFYCKKHEITLVIIPYWDENILDYDYIMKAAGY